MADQKIIGLHVAGRTAVETLSGIIRAEERGIPSAWLTTGGPAPDGLTLCAVAAAQTSRILLGTAITPTYPRHPLVTVQQTLAVAHLGPGRFRLGVGPSHKPTIEGMFGIPFEKPLTHLRAYLTVLKSMLHDGAVELTEGPFRVNARLAAPVDVPVMASALQEKSFELCGEVADGAITWMCPPAYVRDVALPAFKRGAERANRPLPKLVVHVPVCVSEETDAVRDAVRRQFGRYMGVPSYARMTAAAGFEESTRSAMTDDHIDALVAHGDELHVAEQLRAWFALGADEIIAAPFGAGSDPEESTERTISLIAALARR